jgi:hypothetical protein
MKKFLFGICLITAVITIIFIYNKASVNAQNRPLQLSGVESADKIDTITDLNIMKGSEAIWFHHGEYTHVFNVEAADEEEAMEKVSDVSGCTEVFSGSARSAAKTSFDTAGITTYSDIAALRSALPSDSAMRKIGLTSGSARKPQENQNVSISAVKLYAIKREPDEDYHLILGSSVSSSTLIVGEISGLPSSTKPAYSYIKATRDSIKNYFGTDFCGNSGYTIFKSGITLSLLRGSTFYDIDHTPGSIGPSGYNPSTTWEIHPLHDIAFGVFTGTNTQQGQPQNNNIKWRWDNNTLSILYKANANEKNQISLMDMSGKIIYSTQVFSTQGENEKIFAPGNLSKGMYILKFSSVNADQYIKILKY